MRARPGRPQRAVEQHDHRRGAQAHRQDQQREADAEHAVDAAGQPDLDDEADQRQVDGDLREECGDRIRVGGALRLGHRHVQLLLDDRRADRREGDHQRDDLQVPRRPQQPDRFAAADAFFLAGLRRVAGAGRLSRAARHEHHDREADDHDRRAEQQHVLRADRLDQERRQRRAGRAAEAGAAADEAEDALGLPRIVDVVGERPELADQQDRQDLPRRCRTRPRPSPAPIVVNRNQNSTSRTAMPTCVTGIIRRRGTGAHQPGVALHHEADQHAHRRTARTAGCRRRGSR